MREESYHLETRLIHGRMKSSHWRYQEPIVPPISASSAYRLESTHRGAEGFRDFASPRPGPRGEIRRSSSTTAWTSLAAECSRNGLAEAEGGEMCVTFATGMAAISAALMVLLQAGDAVVCHRAVYGCTDSLLSGWLPRLGIEVVFRRPERYGRLGAPCWKRTGASRSSTVSRRAIPGSSWSACVSWPKQSPLPIARGLPENESCR